MTATTCQVRFMANNFIGDDINLSATSEASGFPVENLLDQRRSKQWRADGYFVITSSNNTLYYNDGSARTATIPIGNYTADELAIAIEDAVSATGGTTVIVTKSTGATVWTLTFLTAVTLSLSNSTNAIWDVIGFVGSTDRVGTAFTGDAARNHTVERVVIDLGIPRKPTFFAVVDTLDVPWQVSEAATVTLKANSINDWSAAPLSQTLDQTDAGAFLFLDSLADVEYRFWALEITDKENAEGPGGVRAGHLYLGDHKTLTTTNVANGFSKTLVDPSTVQLSEAGVLYANSLTPYRRFSSMEMRYLDADERRDLEQLFFDVSLGSHFYLSLDPMLELSDSIEEYTFYARFDEQPSLRHVIRDLFSVEFSVTEAV